MIKVSPHSTSERLIPRWFVGTSKGGTAGLRDLMFLHTQRQRSNPRQLVKGEWVLVTQPHAFFPILLITFFIFMNVYSVCFSALFYFAWLCVASLKFRFFQKYQKPHIYSLFMKNYPKFQVILRSKDSNLCVFPTISLHFPCFMLIFRFFTGCNKGKVKKTNTFQYKSQKQTHIRVKNQK